MTTRPATRPGGPPHPRGAFPPPRPPRRGGNPLRVAFVVLGVGFAIVVFGVLGLAALFGSVDRTPAIEIPPGVPPVAAEPAPRIDTDAPGRTADQLLDWAAARSDALGIPTPVLAAYGNAEVALARSRPECGLAWNTLAGIGSVESDHGRYGGAGVDPAGRVVPEVRGVPLDGTSGNEHIADTDGGAIDGDPTLDRAVGPMQFIPATWARWGVDANGDGIADPDNIDDAALSAARYLCDSGTDLATAEGWTRALLAYNMSDAYGALVRDRAAAYGVGVTP